MRARTAALLVSLLVFVTFSPATQNGFVNFDDPKNFLENPHYRGLGWAQLQWMFTAFHMGHYIPVTWLTLGIDYLIWGLHPGGYHLTSSIFHAATAGTFFFLARRLICLAGAVTPGAAMLGAGSAALLFAIHPLRVESVAWATERRDVVSALFFVLAILAYLRYAESTRRRWYALALVLFVAALLGKALAVVLVCALFVLDAYPLRRLHLSRRVWLEKIPFILVAGAASVLAFIALLPLGNTAPLDRLPPTGRIAIAAYGLTFYVTTTVMPTGLLALYELPGHVNPLAWPYVRAYVFVVFVTVATVALRRRWPALLASWVYYGAALFPVLGLFQNGPQAVADRYSYLPCMPLAILAGGLVARAWDRLAPRRAALVVPATAIVVLIALQIATVQQISVWYDSETLWSHAVRVDPANALAHNNLGSALLEQGRLEEASRHFAQAVKWVSRDLPFTRAKMMFSLGATLQQAGDPVGAEAHYREVLSLDPLHARAWNNLGVILATRADFAEAVVAFNKALEVYPGFQDACRNAGRAAKIAGLKPPAGCE